MLNGKAPVIIFTATESFEFLKTNFFNEPLFGSVSLPIWAIPFYLDEEATGIIVEGHSKNLINHTESIVGNDGKIANVEKRISEEVSLQLTATTDNAPLTALLSLLRVINKRVDGTNYRISLFYDDIFLLDASINSMSTSIEADTNKRTISITLGERAEEKSAAAASPTSSLSFIAGDFGGPAGV